MCNARTRTSHRAATRIAAISMAAVVTACRFTQPFQTEMDLTDEAQLGPTSTLAGTSTTEAEQLPNCASNPGVAELPSLEHPSVIAREIVAYLNRAGDPLALHTYLVEAQRSLPAPQGFGRADLNGDRIEELALVLLVESDQAQTPPGTLMIFSCTGDGFTLTYSTAPLPDRSAPAIHHVADLTGDRIADLLFQRELCGAHTCMADTQVLSWQAGELREVFPDSTAELPSPLLEIGAPQTDGSRPISVTATGINSVGAGPFRPTTYTWTWDPELSAFVLASELQAPARFRIHLLHEADQSARGGQLTRALEQYQRVELDEDLQGWIDPERETRILGAYARFRRIVLLTRLDESQRAREQFEGLIIQYAGDPVTAGIVEMGQSYWETYSEGGTLVEACLSARTYASAHASQVLDLLYFGYANPSYTAQDVCLQGAEGQP